APPDRRTYTLSLPDALPISDRRHLPLPARGWQAGLGRDARERDTGKFRDLRPVALTPAVHARDGPPLPHAGEGQCSAVAGGFFRSEEHTSELQSRENFVCRL